MRRIYLKAKALVIASARQSSFFLFLFLSSLSAFALPDDAKHPIKITSDSSTFNYKTGVDHYTGHVIVDQGSSHLTADELFTQKNAQHKMISAIATGVTNLASYSTLPKKGDAILYAKAQKMTFYPLQSIIILEKNVSLIQKENSFHGELMIYNMKDQVVTAPASDKGQTMLIIEPEKLKS